MTPVNPNVYCNKFATGRIAPGTNPTRIINIAQNGYIQIMPLETNVKPLYIGVGTTGGGITNNNLLTSGHIIYENGFMLSFADLSQIYVIAENETDSFTFFAAYIDC